MKIRSLFVFLFSIIFSFKSLSIEIGDEKKVSIGGKEQTLKIIGLLGQGEFGKVFLAKNVETGEEVAVKVPLNPKSASQKEKLKFDVEMYTSLKEAIAQSNINGSVIISRCDDDRITKVLAADDGFIVLEKAQTDLEKFMKTRERITEEEARLLFKPIFKTIYLIHKAGKFHGDMKPDNIFIFSQNKGEVDPEKLILKLADFASDLPEIDPIIQSTQEDDLVALGDMLGFYILGKDYEKKLNPPSSPLEDLVSKLLNGEIKAKEAFQHEFFHPNYHSKL